MWTDEESKAVSNYTVANLSKPQVCDEDNSLHFAFVISAANLQASAFTIAEMKPMFDCRGIVSVIEPSLATTNAIIAATTVHQLNDFLKGVRPSAHWLSMDPRGSRISFTSIFAPVAGCSVCGRVLCEVYCDTGGYPLV